MTPSHAGRLAALAAAAGLVLGGPCGGLADTDGDGVKDRNDSCPSVANPAQGDFDGDGAGDACDPAVAVLGGAECAVRYGDARVEGAYVRVDEAGSALVVAEPSEEGDGVLVPAIAVPLDPPVLAAGECVLVDARRALAELSHRCLAEPDQRWWWTGATTEVPPDAQPCVCVWGPHPEIPPCPAE